MSRERILLIVTEEEAEKARAEGYTKTEAGAYIIDPANIVIPEPEPWEGMPDWWLNPPGFPTPNRKTKA